MRKVHLSAVVALAALFVITLAYRADTHVQGKKILFFTKSSGFQHSVVTREADRLAHAERILVQIAAQHGYEVIPTKDGSQINAENLKKYDAVSFYTSGDLTQAGTDQFPPISEQGLQELYDWVEAGGAFSAWHAAVDTLRRGNADEETTEYTKLVGAAFLSHAQQEEGTVVTVDPQHPTMKNVPLTFRFPEEWYINDQWNVLKNIHVLQILDTQTMKQDAYTSLDPFPITWCSNYGKGKVFVSVLGHREDVWENHVVQGILIDGIAWTLGDIPGDATPNYDEVMAKYKKQ